MKLLTSTLLTVTLFAAPASAFNVPTDMPNLTFPTETVTQSCITPTTLTTACKPRH